MSKCIDCYCRTDNVTPCGLTVCERCCALCYICDTPCLDVLDEIPSAPEGYRDARNQIIYNAWQGGATPKQIAKAFGLTAHTITKIVRRAKSRTEIDDKTPGRVV